jgi:hypothetical protein
VEVGAVDLVFSASLCLAKCAIICFGDRKFYATFCQVVCALTFGLVKYAG